MPPSSSVNAGFTLIELLICIGVLYTVISIAAPSAKRILDHHRIAADINRTNAMLRFARTNAISLHETIKLCPSNDYATCTKNWHHPLIVFADKNRNNFRDDNEILLGAGMAISTQHKMKGPKSAIVFYENGDNASPASLLLCPRSNDDTLARALYVSLQGHVRPSVDYNQDGIEERIKHVNLVCSAF